MMRSLRVICIFLFCFGLFTQTTTIENADDINEDEEEEQERIFEKLIEYTNMKDSRKQDSSTNDDEGVEGTRNLKMVDEDLIKMLEELIKRSKQSYEKLYNQETSTDNAENKIFNRASSQTDEISMSDAYECNSEQCIRKLLKKYNSSCTRESNRAHLAEWNYLINLTKPNAKLNTQATLKKTEWSNRMIKIFQILKRKNIPNLSSEQKRMLDAIVVTASTFNETIIKKLSEIQNKISSIYSTGKVFYNGKPLAAGETGVTEFFRTSRNCSALTEVWKGWRDATGKKIRPYFKEMVKFLNMGARYNDYPDYGFYEWFTDFRQKDFNKRVMDLYHKLSPYYKEFHAFIRYKLKQFYPACVDAKGPIPAQLLGNVWGQQFNNIFDILTPYPKVHRVDVSSALQNGNWTVLKMFKAAETFFHSIGLFKMTDKFWKYSMLKKPKNRSVECHGSAFDLFSYRDFRIKMCTTLTGEDFTTVHHEMGHITYYMAYEKQPCLFRAGANSGFHEAIGDTIALSASTNNHLEALNLLKNFKRSDQSDINTLMRQALEKLAFIPYGLLVDVWRWRVFNGTITSDNYNEEWWKLKNQLQGLKPPIKRTEADFDPGAKYHVANNVPYIRYFVSFILQFQFYEAMCNASGHKGPLFKCDFYRSKEAGALLKSMLSVGASRPWPETLKRMTGQSDISVDSYIRYFQPLFDWMKKYRLSEGYPIGWKLSD